ncbi:hypothetical protein DBR42_16165 [Pelomonas sp. HMWF004]|nr:hypothetical protein DBR42_16165 [Pelomonas sp. HMWF004]
MKQAPLAAAAVQGAELERFRKPPRRGKGRPPIGLERMLRMYFLQHWFNLADEACEEALLDSTVLSRFVGIDLGSARERERDPEMHQIPKDQQWFFGLKLHLGADSRTGLAHSAVVTAANVHDQHAVPQLLHGAELDVHGDSAYASQQELIASKAPQARAQTNRRVGAAGIAADMERIVDRIKSKARSRVEHMFAVLKRQWGFSKVRYKGLANIYMARKHLVG